MKVFKGFRRSPDAWGLVRTGGEDRLVRASRAGKEIAITAVPPAADESAPRQDIGLKVPRPAVVYPVQDVSLRHERLNLPPMSAALVDKAVRQHCLSSQPADDVLEISYTSEAGRDRQSDLLVVWTQRQVVESALSTLAMDAYQVKRFTTSATALAGLLRAAGRPERTEGSTVLVHLGETTGTVACYSEGALVLGREFALPDAPDDPDLREGAEGEEHALDGQWGDTLEAGEQSAGILPIEPRSVEQPSEPVSDILGEISRTILLFNHRLRGNRAGRILLSADLFPVAQLVPLCEERFGLPTSLLIDELDLDLSTFGEGEEARERAAPWVLAIAAAVTGLTGEPDINLLPVVLALRQRRRTLIALATAVGLFCLLAMAAYHVSYLATTASIARHLRTHAAVVEASDQMIANLEELRSRRQMAFDRLRFLEAKRRPAAVVAEVLQALSAATTDSLFVEELELLPVANLEGQYTLRVHGQVATRNSADARDQFGIFHDRLRDNPLMARAGLGPLMIETSMDGNGSVLLFELLAEVTSGEEAR